MIRVAIIGGGIGGLTTAIALRQFGFEPEVYEQAPALLDVGAAIAIWPNAMRVFERLGLAKKVLEHAGQMQEIQWLDQTGRPINKVTIAEPSELDFTPAVALHRADLQEILLDSLPSGSIHLGSSLIDYSQDDEKVIAHFANGHSSESEFLVGADGIHSRVRTELLDESSRELSVPVAHEPDLARETVRGTERVIACSARYRDRVLDRRRRIAALVGDDGEVVVGAGVGGIDGERAPEQIARVGRAAGRLLDQRQVHERFDIARIGVERDAELGGGSRR